MIESLAVENYRSFESYRIDRLATVNLLVGRNNCGKTSLLEAVDFVAAKGSLASLVRTAIRRNEMVAAFDEDALTPHEYLPEMSHFFHGHAAGHESQFVIDAATSGSFCVSIFKISMGENTAGRPQGSNGEMQVRRDENKFPVSAVLLFPDNSVAERGVVRFARRRSTNSASPELAPVEFITTSSSLDILTLSHLWNQIIRASQEQQVVDALQLVDSAIESVQFLTEAGAGAASILLGTSDRVSTDSRRVPLGSYGDGMKHLLALSMALARTSDGVLLIDEIDTGLHYSVLTDVWKLVIETAIRNNVQVFATTHSLDCLRGLDAVCQDRPDFAGEVLVHKLDRSLDFAVTLDAADFQMAIEQELEVR